MVMPKPIKNPAVPDFINRDMRPNYKHIEFLNHNENYSKGVLIRGMRGLGDNIFQRAFIKELTFPVWLDTPWPELYEDLPQVNFVRCFTTLRTQNKNVEKQKESRWGKVPRDVVELQITYGTKDLANGSIQEKMYNLFRVRPRNFDLPSFEVESKYVPNGAKLALIRPATVRKEWTNSARNPNPDYLYQASKMLLAEGYTVISVCDLEPGQEWIVGTPPLATHTFHNGELFVKDLLGLVQRCSVLVGGVGWLLPAAMGSHKPCLMIGGGNGGHNAPEKVADYNFVDTTNLTWILPETYCRCTDMRHDCKKSILNFPEKFQKWLDKVSNQDKDPLNFIPKDLPFLEVGPDPTFLSLAKTGLVWLPEHGMGWFPVPMGNQVYDQDYFQKYKTYEETDLGAKLTRARVAFVGKFYAGPMVDVGIGSGHFIQKRPLTSGYDVNPFGVKWLEERSLFINPNLSQTSAVSFWDSLEHIRNPKTILDNIQKWVFTSLPIFRDCEHVLASKHFRKDEHCWYWTLSGFTKWMESHGFELRGTSDFESVLGREDIMSFAFRRKE